MVSKAASPVVKKIVTLLERFPKDRIKHHATFRSSQIERFCSIGGVATPKDIIEERKQQDEAKKSTLKINTETIKQALFPEEQKSVNYQKDMFTDDILTQQYRSLKNIYESKWEKYYKIDKKLLVPKGNPNYYVRLLNDLEKGGQEKEGLFPAFKTILTGKY
ncbi:DEKNAAC100234 [Brettanomyces naardenensis]|uniref:DEKNAAC100234 n=1 Tax=Brettanomyces naardenensis TaxID=13370 RepID=A0A448YFM9_BRENA|nr:DEKNAAC100234 [Brettanomyces naardenensis]